MCLHRFINRLPVSSHTYTQRAGEREREREGRRGREKKNRLFCAAAEWEQKTNGGSYIRERQNERDRDGKRKEGQQERPTATGETLSDGEAVRKQVRLKVLKNELLQGGKQKERERGRGTSKREKRRKIERLKGKEREIKDREQSCWSESRA